MLPRGIALFLVVHATAEQKLAAIRYFNSIVNTYDLQPSYNNSETPILTAILYNSHFDLKILKNINRRKGNIKKELKFWYWE
jgi:hypothetical protein